MEKHEIVIDTPNEFLKNNRVMLKKQQWFRKEKHNIKNKKVNEENNQIFEVQIMIKEYNQLIRQKHMHTERIKSWCLRKKKLNVTR